MRNRSRWSLNRAGNDKNKWKRISLPAVAFALALLLPFPAAGGFLTESAAQRAADLPTSVFAAANPQRNGVVIADQELIIDGAVETREMGPRPTGQVRLIIGEVAREDAPTATLDEKGSFTLPAIALPVMPPRAGPHVVSVAYEGDDLYMPSVSSPMNLTAYESDPGIALTSSRNPSRFGKAVTFKAHVFYNEADDLRPQGTVMFSVDEIVESGMLPLDSNGEAMWSTSLDIGRHVVSANYIPVADDLTTSGAQIKQVITPPTGKVEGGLSLVPSPLRGKARGLRVSGELVIPAGLSRKDACTGRVSVRIEQGKDRVADKTPLRRDCHYSLSLTLPTDGRADRSANGPHQPEGEVAVAINAQFFGNDIIEMTGGQTISMLAPWNRPWGPPIKWMHIVALGDSYISGEGGRWAGNTNVWPPITPTNIDALGQNAYYDNLTNGSNPPGQPVSGTYELIPHCHRSRAQEAFVGGALKGLNLACSGATTASRYATGVVNPGFKPGIDFVAWGSDTGQAAKLSALASTHKVRVVLLGIGGNDFGFTDVLGTCLKDYLTSLNRFGVKRKIIGWGYDGTGSKWNPNNYGWIYGPEVPYDDRKYCSEDAALANLLSPTNVNAVTAKVKGAILNVAYALAMQGYQRKDYTILVQTGPDPIAGSGDIRYSQGLQFSIFNSLTWWDKPRQLIGGCGFWDKDLDWIHNSVLPTMNTITKNAAAAAANTNVPGWSPTYKPKVAVLDVEDAFAGRRLCQTGTNVLPSNDSWTATGAVDRSEWVNQIRTYTALIPGSPYQMQEGFHPNYWGQLALRACLRLAYPKTLTNPPQNGKCTRAGVGLNTKSPPEPPMQWNP
jgi:hypothetical protein